MAAIALPDQLPTPIAGSALVLAGRDETSFSPDQGQTLLTNLAEIAGVCLMAKLEAGFQKNAFTYVLALRLIPAAPFWVVNIIPALLGMRLNQFVLATFIGITPGTLIYVWVARSFDTLLSRGQNPDLSVLSDPSVIVPLLILALLSFIPIFWKLLKAR